LIIGEPGVGKSMIAQAIHDCTNPIASLKIISHASNLDHEIQDIVVKELNNVDTIIVEDIEEFSFLQQTLISQLIEKRPTERFIRVIVTAKNKINDLVERGKLFGDLADILSNFETIFLPPLSERREDIPLLIQHFITAACRATNKKIKALDINAIDILSRQTWMQNVHELKSVVEQAVLVSKNEMIELPGNILDEYNQLANILNNIKEKKKFAFDEALENLERTLIERALEATGFNQTKSANILGISDANFRYRLRKYKFKRRNE